ncbi:N-acetyltransferase 5 [Mollisia scopiformis]|uniref:N-acetyltransferase 5 n=1 Tax=Mollisia scopiformis TaxID=149040 RepID=A0A194XNK6_MOLSC|nr:N-acetyltransferase 5 [Mollisia scopiformis]KUJ21748.1 N-acetyltransferase 5 [Mollisia scopiformis]
MTSLRHFNAMDVFKFNATNLDPLTETYDLEFYFSYLARWPNLFIAAEAQDGTITGYMMGKLESSPSYLQFSEHYLPFHAHVTALTVAPHARRLVLAQILTRSLERGVDEYDAWFVDLYVRRSNKIAQALYGKMGYSVYRRVLDYYVDGLTGDAEDGLDMRKPLRRDRDSKHIRENGENFTVTREDVF